LLFKHSKVLRYLFIYGEEYFAYCNFNTCNFCKKMEKEQDWSVTRFLFLEGKSSSEIKERLDAVYGDRQKLV